MADSRRFALGHQLDIEQILLEAQHRWLRPAEICEILRNYNKFRIAPEPANRPPSGSLFLFDRKVLRYFRKDGHNWRKKKDGKTVKEAHERLKSGSVDVLHCYYAHGEDNVNFQRRSYWLLEEEHSNIVLVHYREVKGNRTHYNRDKESEGISPESQETGENIPISDVESSVSSKFQPYSNQVTSQTTDPASLNSTPSSEYADAESVYNHQSSSNVKSFLELLRPGTEKMDDALPTAYYPVLSNDYEGKFQDNPEMDFFSLSQGDKIAGIFNAAYEPQKYLDLPSWENLMENSAIVKPSSPFQSSHLSTRSTLNMVPGQGNEITGQVPVDAFGGNLDSGNLPHVQTDWQKLPSGLVYNVTPIIDENVSSTKNFDSLEFQHPDEHDRHAQNNIHGHIAAVEVGSSIKTESESNVLVDEKDPYSVLKQPLLGGVIKQGLKKLDSFDRWMTDELGDVNESQMQSSSENYWEAVGTDGGVDDSNISSSQVQLDSYMLGPSLSNDQLYSIIDFSPNCAYTGSEVKVLITGKFLKSQNDMVNYKWACMFGELEVPAEIVSDGDLRCCTPPHEAGRVPFYVTCANRLACSEIREFEFQVHNLRDVDSADTSSANSTDILLHMRFVKLISLSSAGSQNPVTRIEDDYSSLSSKISSFIKDDNGDWDQIQMVTTENESSQEKVRDQVLQKFLKEKLHVWLLQKVAEGGRGPSVLDDGGQGVLHFAAALGYDWAIPLTVAAGVSINFRDVNGWTALHWAAFYGRERTVAFLISQGAAPGALTDPSPKYTTGRTPADLASCNGHKGIAGYLAESALSSHLSSLKLKDAKEGGSGDISGLTDVQSVAATTTPPISDGDFQHGSSMKDSLAAVCNATQAAARIHQVFRVQSFQKKQLKEYDEGAHGMSDERALSLLAVKTNKTGHNDEPVHAAATRIQNKFRSYKGRKEFLILRRRVVKIQAHVRGHQVRKNYKKIVWSVGFIDKVILRWKRKGKGLSGFRQEALPEGSSMQDTSKEDDYDFLKEGRKQTEDRMQKALARVKSMVQYPEARDQYRRLLNVVSEIQETKAATDMTLNNSDEAEAYVHDDLIDLEALLGDDTYMSTED